MKLNHSYQLVHKQDREMACQGYGFEGYYNLKFRSNQDIGRSVMHTIAKELVCYQYDHDKDEVEYKFDSADWDLFFWCDSNFAIDSMERVDDGRDMSYFTLGFNKKHGKDKQEEILARTLKVLEKFEVVDPLEVVVEHDVVLDDKKMREDARVLAPQLVGKRCSYTPPSLFGFAETLDGRIAEHNGVYYFMKKRARNKGWRMEEKDIIEIALQLGVKEAVA